MSTNVFGQPLPAAPATVASLPGQMTLIDRWAWGKKRCRTCPDLHFTITPEGEFQCPDCQKKARMQATKSQKRTTKPIHTGHINLPDESSPRTDEALPIELIDIVPGLNPRIEFDPVAMAELGDSIKLHGGLLQPVIVRPKAGGRYDLMAGERRFRASRDNVGLKTIFARIVTCDDELQAAITDDENRQRVQLNPIEAAASLQRRLKASGKSQKAFGESIGLSQAEVSNQIRLLQLPATMQAMVISGEIIPSDARSVVPFCDIPEIIADIEKSVEAFRKREEKISGDVFRRVIGSAASAHSRPVTGYWFDSKNRENFQIDLEPLTAEIRKALDIREVPKKYEKGTELRCFNIPAWNDAQAKWKAAKDAEDAKDDAEDQYEPPPRDPQRRQEELMRVLRRYRMGWTQARIAEWLPTTDANFQLRLLIHFAGTRGEDSFESQDAEKILAAHSVVPVVMVKESYGETLIDLFHSLANCQDDEVEAIRMALLQNWVQQLPSTWASNGLTPAFVERLADDMDIDIKDWKVEKAFLDCFEDDELQDLAKAFKIKKPPADRESLVSLLLLRTDLPLPEILKSVPLCEPKRKAATENDDDPNFEADDDDSN